ncbi:MAG: PilZ domain-containing protein [Solirubrobacteraceae bacterium]
MRPTAANAKRSKKASQGDSEETADGADGPSVATHPRAARQVARAKGWAGLAGFLVGGYMSLPTNTLTAVVIRALVAGTVCYLAAWACALFVWRQLVMFEYTVVRRRGGKQPRQSASIPRQDAAAPSRRENVRVQVERPVLAYVGSSRSRVETSTIDISGGGMLVAGLNMLEADEQFEFQLTIAPGAPPIEGTGRLVRTDPQGRCAIAFDSIGNHEERRLIQFIAECQRAEMRASRFKR